MIRTDVRLKRRNKGLPGYYKEMYCHACGCFFPASNTGVPCKHCRSTQVTPGHGWLRAKDSSRMRA